MHLLKVQQGKILKPQPNSFVDRVQLILVALLIVVWIHQIQDVLEPLKNRLPHIQQQGNQIATLEVEIRNVSSQPLKLKHIYLQTQHALFKLLQENMWKPQLNLLADQVQLILVALLFATQAVEILDALNLPPLGLLQQQDLLAILVQQIQGKFWSIKTFHF